MKKIEVLNDVYNETYTSGDWLTLTEAVDLFNRMGGGNKTVNDVLKAGYLGYFGIDQLLDIFVVVKKTAILKIANFYGGEVISPQLENLICCIGGTFMLNADAIERILLLGEINSCDCLLASRRLASMSKVDGWRERKIRVGEYNIWFEDFVCSTTNDIVVTLSDLRVDGQQFKIFVEQLKAQDEQGGIDNLSIVSRRGECGISWIESAKKIALLILQKKPRISIDKLSGEVKKEMDDAYAKGDVSMAGRGGKVPAADSIKRHALAGIKK